MNFNIAKSFALKGEDTRSKRGDDSYIEKASTKKGRKFGYTHTSQFIPGYESQAELDSMLPDIDRAFHRKTIVQLSLGWNSGYTHSVLLDFRDAPPKTLRVIDNHTVKWHEESDPSYFKPFISKLASRYGYKDWSYEPVNKILNQYAARLAKEDPKCAPGTGQCLKYTAIYLGMNGLHR